MKSRAVFLLALLTPCFILQAATVLLVDHTAGWRYLKGTTNPPVDWKTAADAALGTNWLGPAPGGFGYGDSDDATVLDDMEDNYTTVYIRQSFEVSGLDTSLQLQLVMDWDDGFVAWLDGVEIARDGAPGAVGTEPSYRDEATSNHDPAADGGDVVTFDLGPVGDRLSDGTHVLAVMGLNGGISSSDLTLIADLKALNPNIPVLSHTNVWRLFRGRSVPLTNWQTLPDMNLGAFWPTALGGVGYGDGDDATLLSDMRLNYTTAYIRQTFTVTNTFDTNLNALLLADWDDGFVAYLDGVEIARALAPGVPGVEPSYSDTATAQHEASAGGGNPEYFDLGPAASVLTPGLHILAVIGLNESIDSSDFSMIFDIEVGEPPPPDPGLISEDTVWTLANSPYIISNNITVAPGVTLTIEPGVEVLFNQSRRMDVFGRLLAVGTTGQRILFSRSASAASWDRIEFDGGPLESVIAFADFAFATGGGNVEATDTRLYLENVTWSDTDSALFDVTRTSFIVKDCVFPSIGSSEPFHFASMPDEGYARIQGCVFDAPSGYNDVIDFTGGNRPGPIAEFIDNVFLAAVDECFDLDGTDAHLEGNIFMNVKQDTTRSSSSNAISTGDSGGDTSEVVIVRNIFYNCDHAILLKEFCSAVVQNNTVVGVTANPAAAQPVAFMNFGEPNRDVEGGAGALLDGNIVWDLNGEAFLNFTNEVMFLTVNRSIIQDNVIPGTGNSTNDPMFVSLTGITAANIRSNLALLPGSPAIGAGPHGRDMGALVPAGAWISGEPDGPVTNTSLTLPVGGPGIYAYRWKLNDGPWSDEVPLTNSFLIHEGLFDDAQPVTLTNLTNGTYTVYVVGKNSAGTWQSTNSPTASRTFTIDTSLLLFTDINYLGTSVFLDFVARAGETYSVQYTDNPASGVWLKAADVPAQPDTGVVTVQDSVAGITHRFYRLVNPAQP